ncbi:MAG: two-component system response regulator [Denitrovibrio sp.]|nr:MAG: two-component system response regulator [Denitrovibrio sp.]
MKELTVLIVEDDIKISKIHSMFVEKIEGISVAGIANSLNDAKSMAEILEPDIILLDLYFPEEGSGMDILHNLRSTGKPVDVILITAAKEAKSLQAALRGGVFDYLIKPVVFERFEESLMRLKEHRSEFDHIDSIDQQEVDAFFSKKRGAHTSDEVPKGIDMLTLKKIKTAFAKEPEDGFSAEAVGELVGVSRSTARRYLEYLISIDYLFADQIYGTVGRPERKYFKKK